MNGASWFNERRVSQEWVTTLHDTKRGFMRAGAPRLIGVALTLMLVTGALLCGASCGKHVYSRDDLTVTLSKHHIDLRWGRLGNAALVVKPEMREAFLKTWTARASTIELQDIEIAAVAMAPDENSADVVINITYVERDTMTVKTEAVSERWIRTEHGWIAEQPAVL